MFRTIILAGAVGLVIAAARPALPRPDEPPTKARPIVLPKVAHLGTAIGIVTEVGDSGFTLRADTTFVIAPPPAPAKGPWYFSADPDVLGVIDPIRAFIPSTYRIEDLKIGDRVAADFVHQDGFNSCPKLRILRRPGGKVPPQPWEGGDPDVSWEKMMQAEQDWEEKGTPIRLKRWTNFLTVPYPPVAPMPRPAKPK